MAQGQVDVVQHHDDADAVLACAPRKQVEHGDLVVEVEVGERLVEEVQPGLLRQQGGDGEALALAAGERMHFARAEAGEVHRRQRLARKALVLAALPGPAVEMRMAADQRRLQHRRLEGVEVALRQQAAQAGGAAQAELFVGFAAEQKAAGLGLAQAGQRRQQCGLAGAIAAEDGQALSCLKIETETGGDAHVADIHFEVANGQQRRHDAPPRGLRVSR